MSFVLCTLALIGSNLFFYFEHTIPAWWIYIFQDICIFKGLECTLNLNIKCIVYLQVWALEVQMEDSRASIQVHSPVLCMQSFVSPFFRQKQTGIDWLWQRSLLSCRLSCILPMQPCSNNTVCSYQVILNALTSWCHVRLEMKCRTLAFQLQDWRPLSIAWTSMF